MDTYLNAVEQYIAHCNANGYSTKVIFTTGPVDDGYENMAGTENGFQRELKHDYIRNYVKADNSRILFDYADILCWNNDGVEYNSNWNDGGTLRSHANIHPDNMMDYNASWSKIAHTEDGDHIGEVGALRLAKAMWWMLARIAGWNGVVTKIDETKEESFSPLIEIKDDELKIKLGDSDFFKLINLYNLQGRLLASKNIDGNLCVFNTANIETGMYILSFSNSKIIKTKKIIIH